MASISGSSFSRTTVAAFACIGMALATLLALTVWGTYRELMQLRKETLESELNTLRSLGQRTVGRLERDLEITNAQNLSPIADRPWLAEHWEKSIDEKQDMYAAIVNSDGLILRHSNRSLEGQRLPHNWYRRMVHEAGGDVVFTNSPSIGSVQDTYDVHVPIQLHGQTLGAYHVGVPVAMVESRLDGARRDLLYHRAGLLAGVSILLVLSVLAVIYVATHSITLRKAVDAQAVERATQVGQLAAGLAHEIRNPLHAIQLNLHTLQRLSQRGESLSQEEVATLLDQSSQEIERIGQLMQQLVSFAAPAQPRDETIDVTKELRDVVDFIDQEMLRSNIQVETRLPRKAVLAHMDHGRLRQIMLNLLQNAQQAMEGGGNLRVSLQRSRGQMEIAVADTGSGISATDRHRIFEPFFSTRANGSGLGLALVKRFVEDVNGDIRCEDNEWGGTTFRILLPEMQDQNP